MHAITPPPRPPPAVSIYSPVTLTVVSRYRKAIWTALTRLGLVSRPLILFYTRILPS